MIKKILLGVVTVSVVLSSSAMASCKTGNFKNSCNYKKITGHNTTNQVIKAVSKTGISASQTKKIADGIAAYEATTNKIKKMKIFPVDSFINDRFDEKRFIKEMSEKYIAAVAAKATLFKFVFSVLNEEQRKIFKREYAAPLIEHIVKSY